MQLSRKNRVCPKHFAGLAQNRGCERNHQVSFRNSNLIRRPFTDWSVNRKEVDWFNWMATLVNEAETVTGVLGRILFWYFGSCPLMLRRTSPKKKKEITVCAFGLEIGFSAFGIQTVNFMIAWWREFIILQRTVVIDELQNLPSISKVNRCFAL